VVVHLLWHAPAVAIDSSEARLQRAQSLEPFRVGGRGVVGDATSQPWRLLESAPLLEERQQLTVGAGLRMAGEAEGEQQGGNHRNMGHQAAMIPAAPAPRQQGEQQTRTWRGRD